MRDNQLDAANRCRDARSARSAAESADRIISATLSAIEMACDAAEKRSQ